MTKWWKRRSGWAGILITVLLTASVAFVVAVYFGWLSGLWFLAVAAPWFGAAYLARMIWVSKPVTSIKLEQAAGRWVEIWQSLRAEITTGMQSLYQIGAISGAVVVGLVAAYGVAVSSNRLGAAQGGIQRAELLGYVLLVALTLIFIGQAKQIAGLHATCRLIEATPDAAGSSGTIWHDRFTFLSDLPGFLELAGGAAALATASAVGLLFLASGLFPAPTWIRYSYYVVGLIGFLVLSYVGYRDVRGIQETG